MIHSSQKEWLHSKKILFLVLVYSSKQIIEIAKMLSNPERAFLIGIGTTFYVSNIGQYYFANLADCRFSSYARCSNS